MRLNRAYGLFLSALGAIILVISLFLAPAVVSTAATQYDWSQFNFDPQHSGNNTLETRISLANVSQLHRLFQIKLQGTYLAVADGAPVYLSSVQTNRGPRNLLFVTTMVGDIIAVDALTGEQIWDKAHPPLQQPCLVNGNGVPCYTTSSPAIDPNRQFVYAYALDGYVHKYKVGDGTEITDGSWPELVTTKAFNEKGSSPLGIATDRAGNTYLYVVNSGYPGDGGDYQGHLTAINLTTGAQHVFNAVCSDHTDLHFELGGSNDCPEVQAAIWGRGGAIYDSDLDRVFFATGNGKFSPDAFHWGDTVLALHSDGTGDHPGVPLDTYTPSNAAELDDKDLDLGSTSPAVLPAVGDHHYTVQGGKDALLRIINLDDMSGHGGPGNQGGEVGSPLPLPQKEQILSQPAVWTNPVDGTAWVFVATVSGLSGIPLNVTGDGWDQPWTFRTSGCESPIIANGVLFCAGESDIKAFDPLTGNEVWHDNIGGTIHWQSPIVVNGVLYITDNSTQITAYSLENGS